MIKHRLWFGLMAIVSVSNTFGGIVLPQQAVTLYPPRDKVTGKYDENRACFSFRYGALKAAANGDWDLGYGFAAINNQDWFVLHNSTENRTVIKDLGEFNWTDSFKVPELEPLPVLPQGERRHVTIDASGDTGKLWEKTTKIMAKVVNGHIYLMRIKDEVTDFYVLFRVEGFEQGDHCMISWKLL